MTALPVLMQSGTDKMQCQSAPALDLFKGYNLGP